MPHCNLTHDDAQTSCRGVANRSDRYHRRRVGFALRFAPGAECGPPERQPFSGLLEQPKAGDVGFFSAFPLFGVPFILVGFGMLSGPIWAYRKALKTVYVVTNRRAITLDGGRTVAIRSYPPDRLADVYRKERKDGTGDVLISRRA